MGVASTPIGAGRGGRWSLYSLALVPGRNAIRMDMHYARFLRPDWPAGVFAILDTSLCPDGGLVRGWTLSGIRWIVARVSYPDGFRRELLPCAFLAVILGVSRR